MGGHTVSPGLLELLLVLGPAILFALAWAETSGPHGLVVPAGVALSSGAFLADRGQLDFIEITLAAGLGALAGDLTGYWTGRKRAERRGELPRTARFISSRPFVGITLARTVSFARTLMPRAAGASGVPFARFWPLDLCGIGLWLALYIMGGVLASRGWDLATQVVGTGWSILIVTGVVAMTLVSRWKRV
jgi:membrane protein DedA with SNARE-associated domain